MNSSEEPEEMLNSTQKMVLFGTLIIFLMSFLYTITLSKETRVKKRKTKKLKYNNK